jgi:hypothetical protein
MSANTQLSTAQNPEIVNILVALNPAVIKVFTNVRRFLTNWGRYGMGYGLWTQRRNFGSADDREKRLVEKAPSAAHFDVRMAAYGRLAEGVEALPAIKDIGFLRVDASPVAAACRTQALRLRAEYGHALREIAHRRLEEFLARVSELGAALEVKPVDLGSLKGVLAVVAGVLDSKVSLMFNFGRNLLNIVLRFTAR